MGTIEGWISQVGLAPILDDIHRFLGEGGLVGILQSFPRSILFDHAQQTIDFVVQGLDIIHLGL